MASTNRQFRLAARPKGLPTREVWHYVEEPVREPAAGEVLVETRYISLDPAMRGWLNDRKSYIAPVALGQVMRAGGQILDDALRFLALGARVVICGAISQYNSTTRPVGPANYLSLLVNRASMQGLIVFDFADRYGEAYARLAEWSADGRLKSREQVVTGFERFPEALLMLFSGENTGKLVLEVDVEVEVETGGPQEAPG